MDSMNAALNNSPRARTEGSHSKLHGRFAHRGTSDPDARKTGTSAEKIDEGHSPQMHAQHLAVAAQLMRGDDAQAHAEAGARYTFEHGTPTLSHDAAARDLNNG